MLLSLCDVDPYCLNLSSNANSCLCLGFWRYNLISYLAKSTISASLLHTTVGLLSFYHFVISFQVILVSSQSDTLRWSVSLPLFFFWSCRVVYNGNTELTLNDILKINNDVSLQKGIFRYIFLKY